MYLADNGDIKKQIGLYPKLNLFIPVRFHILWQTELHNESKYDTRSKSKCWWCHGGLLMDDVIKLCDQHLRHDDKFKQRIKQSR